jgi:hypothetical protein
MTRLTSRSAPGCDRGLTAEAGKYFDGAAGWHGSGTHAIVPPAIVLASPNKEKPVGGDKKTR